MEHRAPLSCCTFAAESRLFAHAAVFMAAYGASAPDDALNAFIALPAYTSALFLNGATIKEEKANH